MIQTLDAVFDGEVLRPSEAIVLAPNTHVRIILEVTGHGSPQPASFLETALSLNLEGPSDLSERLHDYLYGLDDDAKS